MDIVYLFNGGAQVLMSERSIWRRGNLLDSRLRGNGRIAIDVQVYLLLNSIQGREYIQMVLKNPVKPAAK